jgi:FtsP/CotA-like multicopper oxidase with cupredoxin domain
MKFVVNTALASDEPPGPLGASPTDPVLANGDPNPNAATDPTDLALSFEGDLGSPDESRDVSLNEESSALVCARVLPNGIIRWIASVTPGPDFETRCTEAGGEPFGPKEALLGTVAHPGTAASGIPLMWTDMTGTSTAVEVTLKNGDTVDINVTENPTEGDIEEWSIYNFTMDAHPIHLHLVRFQVVSRGDIADFPIADGTGVEPWEEGFKDTVIAYPDQITKVKALFDIAGLYVWHCHIVEHEDNEMMRPYVVSPAPVP